MVIKQRLPWILVACVLGLTIVALLTGPYPLSMQELIGASASNSGSTSGIVLWRVRLPRICAALLVGGALAAAGACYQTLFRNPLVSPDILGVSAGAGLGAVIGIFLGLPVSAIQLLAFCGGLCAVAVVIAVARLIRNTDPILVMVLTGVVVGAMAGAITSLLKVMADPYDQLPAITFWLLGSLAASNLEDIVPTLSWVALGLVPVLLLSWRINLLNMGDEEAAALGINVTRIRYIVILSATLITASVVAIAGVVGWVGLLIPHIARMLTGPSFGRLLPVSIILGAGYLLLIDTLARTLTTVEIPLGILTAVVGAPFFIWLLARSNRGWR